MGYGLEWFMVLSEFYGLTESLELVVVGNEWWLKFTESLKRIMFVWVMLGIRNGLHSLRVWNEWELTKSGDWERVVAGKEWWLGIIGAW